MSRCADANGRRDSNLPVVDQHGDWLSPGGDGAKEPPGSVYQDFGWIADIHQEVAASRRVVEINIHKAPLEFFETITDF